MFNLSEEIPINTEEDEIIRQRECLRKRKKKDKDPEDSKYIEPID